MRRWSKVALMEYVNKKLKSDFKDGYTISLSQMRYDLESMEFDLGAPIEKYKVGNNHYYRYEDANFSIFTVNYNKQK